MKKVSSVFFAALCSLTIACGGDPCTAVSKCANDPKRTDAEIKVCQDQVKASKDMYKKCTTQIDAQSSCLVNNQQCGADGKSDTTASAAKCTKELADVVTCVASGT